MKSVLLVLALIAKPAFAGLDISNLEDLSLKVGNLDDATVTACAYDKRSRQTCGEIRGITLATDYDSARTYELLLVDDQGYYTENTSFASFGNDESLILNPDLECTLKQYKYEYTLRERAAALIWGIVVKNRVDYALDCI